MNDETRNKPAPQYPFVQKHPIPWPPPQASDPGSDHFGCRRRTSLQAYGSQTGMCSNPSYFHPQPWQQPFKSQYFHLRSPLDSLLWMCSMQFAQTIGKRLELQHPQTLHNHWVLSKWWNKKVQSVINEQQQILNSKKAQMGSMKTEATLSLTHSVMSNTIRRKPISLPRQPILVFMIPQHLLSTDTRNPVKLIHTGSS